MAEQECKLTPDEINQKSLYKCVGETSDLIWQQCQQQIETYNQTRHKTNQQMQIQFDSIINKIDEEAERAIADSDQETLNQILYKG